MKKLYLDVDGVLLTTKNTNASLATAFSRWLTRHPNKVTNYIRNMDALEAVGGNPFMLDMQVEPNTVGIFRNK